MKKQFKSFVQSLLRRYGYVIRSVDVPRGLGPFELARTMISADQPIVFDIGANVGQTLCEFRKLFPSADIHSFEPFPEAFQELEKVVAANPPAHCHRIALSDRNGTATFNVNASSQTNSLLPTAGEANRSWGHGMADTMSAITVPTMTLDSFCSENHIERIDLLKIDAQGAEYDILRGAHRMLESHAIGVTVFELLIVPTYENQRRACEYFTLLDSYGYEFRGFFRPLYGGIGQIAQSDVLFALPKSRRRS